MSNHSLARTQEEIAALFTADLVTGVGKSVKHDSAPKHVAGEAVYVDDRLEFPNQLHVYARMSERAHARIVRIDTAPCYQIPGVAIAITAKDVPGQLDIGAVMPGDPLLARAGCCGDCGGRAAVADGRARQLETSRSNETQPEELWPTGEQH